MVGNSSVRKRGIIRGKARLRFRLDYSNVYLPVIGWGACKRQPYGAKGVDLAVEN